MKLLGMLLLLVLSCATVYGQTKVYVEGQFGPGSLGFKTPHLSVGVSVEQKLKRFEIDGKFLASPDVKTFAEHGHSFNAYVQPGIWLTKHLAIHSGLEYSLYYSEIPIGMQNRNDVTDGFTKPIYQSYKKGGFSPYVGVSIKDSWYGSPGRLDVDYLIPTGCVYATAGNSCPLTSPREHGIVAQQEFEMVNKFHFGVRGGWINYGDQINPFASDPQPRHDTGFAEFVVRYEIK